MSIIPSNLLDPTQETNYSPNEIASSGYEGFIASYENSFENLVTRRLRKFSDRNSVDSRLLTKEEANARYGIEGALNFDDNITEYAAQQLSKDKSAELQRKSIIERSQMSGWQSVGATALDIGLNILDPATLALFAVVPPAGMAKVGGAIGKSLGTGIIGKAAYAGARFGIEGAQAAIPLTVISKGLAISEQEDYTIADAATEATALVAGGAMIGTGLGAAIGVLNKLPVTKKLGTSLFEHLSEPSKKAVIIDQIGAKSGKVLGLTNELTSIESKLGLKTDTLSHQIDLLNTWSENKTGERLVNEFDSHDLFQSYLATGDESFFQQGLAKAKRVKLSEISDPVQKAAFEKELQAIAASSENTLDKKTALNLLYDRETPDLRKSYKDLQVALKEDGTIDYTKIRTKKYVKEVEQYFSQQELKDFYQAINKSKTDQSYKANLEELRQQLSKSVLGNEEKVLLNKLNSNDFEKLYALTKNKDFLNLSKTANLEERKYFDSLLGQLSEEEKFNFIRQQNSPVLNKYLKNRPNDLLEKAIESDLLSHVDDSGYLDFSNIPAGKKRLARELDTAYDSSELLALKKASSQGDNQQFLNEMLKEKEAFQQGVKENRLNQLRDEYINAKESTNIAQRNEDIFINQDVPTLESSPDIAKQMEYADNLQKITNQEKDAILKTESEDSLIKELFDKQDAEFNSELTRQKKKSNFIKQALDCLYISNA